MAPGRRGHEEVLEVALGLPGPGRGVDDAVGHPDAPAGVVEGEQAEQALRPGAEAVEGGPGGVVGELGPVEVQVAGPQGPPVVPVVLAQAPGSRSWTTASHGPGDDPRTYGSAMAPPGPGPGPLGALRADPGPRGGAGHGASTPAGRGPGAGLPRLERPDVVAHLTAVCEDVLDGRLSGPPTEEQTGAQVARFRGRPLPEVLARWEELGPGLGEAIDAFAVWPAVLDVATHEHDIRGAVGRPGARDSEVVRLGSDRLLTWMRPRVVAPGRRRGRDLRPRSRGSGADRAADGPLRGAAVAHGAPQPGPTGRPGLDRRPVARARPSGRVRPVAGRHHRVGGRRRSVMQRTS